MTLQQKKSMRFGKAIESLRRYKEWQERLLKNNKISEKEFFERISKRAEMLNL